MVLIGEAVRARPDDAVPEGSATPPQRVSRRVAHGAVLLVAMILTGAIAVAADAALDASLPTVAMRPFERPLGVDALNVAVLWLVLVWLVALVGRLWVGIAVFVTLVGALTAAQAAKVAVLQAPLLPNDRLFLSEPGFLASMVTGPRVAVALGGLILAAAVPLALGRVLRSVFPPWPRGLTARGRWIARGSRLVLVLVVGAALVSTTGFNRSGNPWRAAYDAAGADWKPFSQPGNYRLNGFVAGALFNMPNQPMERPSGYSEHTMRDLAERYAEAAAVRNADLDPEALADTNVVMILSESFADPGALAGITLERDPIRLTKQHMATAWGGTVLTNDYATGTSTMEYSSLTGQSMALLAPQIWAPYQDFMTGMRDYPSIVEWFNRHGHATVAIHPYLASMYQRDRVYSMLGFDRFTDVETMGHTEVAGTGDYVSDEAAFAEVRDEIDAHDEPVFVHLATMQNHVPTYGRYEDPIKVRASIEISARRAIGGDARGLELTDQALDGFLAELRTSPEPTIVLFYGDHYPGIYPEEIWAQNDSVARFEAPLLVWSNRPQTSRALGTMSASTFMPTIFELAGQAMPPYFELLLEIHAEIGALTRHHIVSPAGVVVERDDLTARQQQLLRDYELVQYDFSVGERYAVEEMFYGPPPT